VGARCKRAFSSQWPARRNAQSVVCHEPRSATVLMTNPAPRFSISLRERLLRGVPLFPGLAPADVLEAPAGHAQRENLQTRD